MVEDPVLDRAYAALADPTRRKLLETLRSGDARITDLAAPLPMTFAGVSRHIGILESAGLVRREVRGREHWLSLQPDGLSEARRGAEMFGEDRIAQMLRRDPTLPTQRLCTSLLESAREFADQPITDDIAILAVRKV